MRILLIYALILTRKLQVETKNSDTDDIYSDSHLYLQSRVVKQQETQLRIFGGEEVAPHAYPFQALLVISQASDEKHMCGGSLISPSLVLTAAHCVSSPESTHIDVFLGVHNLQHVVDSERTQTFRSTSYKWHPDFNDRTVLGDIAIVMLPVVAVLNDYVQPVTVPWGSEDYDGESAIILGWGRTDGGSLSENLQSVEVEVIKNEACRRRHFSLMNMITERHLCASREDGKGGCDGDSGGPLVVDGLQIGLVSFGPNNCSSTKFPTVFTRLNRYKDWIQEMKNSEAVILGIRNFVLGLVFVILALE